MGTQGLVHLHKAQHRRKHKGRVELTSSPLPFPPFARPPTSFLRYRLASAFGHLRRLSLDALCVVIVVSVSIQTGWYSRLRMSHLSAPGLISLAGAAPAAAAAIALPAAAAAAPSGGSGAAGVLVT